MSTLASKRFVPFRPDDSLIPASSNPWSNIPNTFHPVTESPVYLRQELCVDALDDVLQHLWMSGLPASGISPLHRQKLVGRQILICEAVKLHLVSHDNALFIKPIPRCLLDYSYFEVYIATDPFLLNLAMGFLSSYLMLIQYESDFIIASDLKLLPAEATWGQWLKFAASLRTVMPPAFRNRYDFGVLRLGRLNFIMRFLRGKITRGYQALDTSYSNYFSSLFAAAVVGFAYVSVLLSAFQVAESAPNANKTVLNVGYWASMVTLISLAGTLAFSVLWFLVLFADNFMFAAKKKRKALSFDSFEL